VTETDNSAKRLKAYELYLSAGLDGKRRSLRSIAQELGLHLSTIQWYRDKDAWDTKLDAAMHAAGKAEELVQSSLKLKLRAAVFDGIEQLNKIVKDSENDQHRVLAFRELVSTALKTSSLDPKLAHDMSSADFKDDLDWPLASTDPTPTATSTPEEPPGSGSSSPKVDSESESPTP
jgi:hypothetical protein